MLHTKTPNHYYGDNDFWTVTITDRHTGEEKVRKYEDCDNAYEDYCYYKKHSLGCDVEYDHHSK